MLVRIIYAIFSATVVGVILYGLGSTSVGFNNLGGMLALLWTWFSFFMVLAWADSDLNSEKNLKELYDVPFGAAYRTVRLSSFVILFAGLAWYGHGFKSFIVFFTSFLLMSIWLTRHKKLKQVEDLNAQSQSQ